MRPALSKWAEKNVGELAEQTIFAINVLGDVIDDRVEETKQEMSDSFEDDSNTTEISRNLSNSFFQTKEIYYNILEDIDADYLNIYIYVPKSDVPWPLDKVNEYLDLFIEDFREWAEDTYQEGECGVFNPAKWGYKGKKKGTFFVDPHCAEILESNEVEDSLKKVEIDMSSFL
jgi:hypothetical protein